MKLFYCMVGSPGILASGKSRQCCLLQVLLNGNTAKKCASVAQISAETFALPPGRHLPHFWWRNLHETCWHYTIDARPMHKALALFVLSVAQRTKHSPYLCYRGLDMMVTISDFPSACGGRFPHFHAIRCFPAVSLASRRLLLDVVSRE